MTKRIAALLVGMLAFKFAGGEGVRIERMSRAVHTAASVTYTPQIAFGATFDPVTLTWAWNQYQVSMSDSGDSARPAVPDSWEFGDGTAPAPSTTDQVVQHTFPPGDRTYRVSLKVAGVTTSQKILIVPEGPPPPPPSPPPPVVVAVVGAGIAGNWITEIELANPTDQPLQVQLSAMLAGFAFACPFDCSTYRPTLPANGTLTVQDSWIRDAPQNVLHTIYVVSTDPTLVPVVRARARNTLNPQLTTELPVARLSTITGLAATILNFPSAIRAADTHVNLVIASIVPDGGGPAFSARIEAYSLDGTLIGGMNVSNDTGGNYSPNIFLVDVLAQMGVTSLADGQIKVTRLSGEGALWGGMAVVYPAGAVALSPGINP